MGRRGFLRSMLALGVASFVTSGGVDRGVLMPVRRRRVWTPDPRIEVLGVDGVPLGAVSFPNGYAAGGQGRVTRTGRICGFLCFDTPLGEITATPDELVLNSTDVCAGDTICFNALTFARAV